MPARALSPLGHIDREQNMLGPLPRLYSIIVSVIALVVCVAAGAWMAYVLPYSFLVSAGAGLGLAVGGLCTFFLLHEFQHHPTAQTSRARRTHSR